MPNPRPILRPNELSELEEGAEEGCVEEVVSEALFDSVPVSEESDESLDESLELLAVPVLEVWSSLVLCKVPVPLVLRDALGVLVFVVEGVFVVLAAALLVGVLLAASDDGMRVYLDAPPATGGYLVVWAVPLVDTRLPLSSKKMPNPFSQQSGSSSQQRLPSSQVPTLGNSFPSSTTRRNPKSVLAGVRWIVFGV
jgi:hypothetical protein